MGSTSLPISLPPPREWHRGTGSGSCSQFVTRCLCCSFFLTLCHYSFVGSLPRETVLHELLQCKSFPWTVDSFHGVQSFRNRLPQRRSPVGSQVLPENLIQHGIFSPWVHRSCQEPAPPRTLHRVRASSGHPPAPPWTSMGCRSTSCLTMVCSMDCRGVSAPVSGVPPPPPSALTLVSPELLLSHILTPLFSFSCAAFFSPS